MPRENTEELLSMIDSNTEELFCMIDSGYLTAEQVFNAFASYLGEAQVTEMMELNGWIVDSDDDF